MRYAILLVLLSGCTPSAVAQIDRPGIIAEIAVRTACILFDQPDAPPAPRDGCDTGCQCAGTGKEKTGDGLSTVDCRCPDGCKCKSSNSSEIPNSSPESTPVTQTIADPPLVPIESNTSDGRMECKNGTCYWIDSRGRRFKVIR